MDIHFSLHRFLLPKSSSISASQLTPHQLRIIRHFLHKQHLKKQNKNFRLNIAGTNKNQKRGKNNNLKVKATQNKNNNKNKSKNQNKNQKLQHLFILKKSPSLLEPYVNMSEIYSEIEYPIYYNFLSENHTKTDIILDIAEIYDDDEEFNGLLSPPTRQHLLEISGSRD